MSKFHDDNNGFRIQDDMGQIYGHLNSDQSDDAGLMADAILDWLGNKDAADFSSEDVAALDQMLEGLEALVPEEEDDIRASLDEFHQKYKPLFEEKDAEPVSQTQISPIPKKRFHSTFRRLTAVAAAIALMVSCMAAAQAFGFDVFDTIARWTDDTFHVWIKDVPHAEIKTNPLRSNESASYESLQEAVIAFEITERVVPSWIPERFAIQGVTAVNTARGVLIYADYLSNDGYLQISFREVENGNFTNVEKNNMSVDAFSIRGIKHYVLSDINCEKVVWLNGELECQIMGIIANEELREIVDSIY